MSRLSMYVIDEMLEQLCKQLDGGTVEFYDGPKPSEPKFKPRGRLLGTMRLGVPAFRVSNGEAIAKPEGHFASSVLGMHTWARMRTKRGKSVVDVYRDQAWWIFDQLHIQLA